MPKKPRKSKGVTSRVPKIERKEISYDIRRVII
jgi:hypothetical protein